MFGFDIGTSSFFNDLLDEFTYNNNYAFFKGESYYHYIFKTKDKLDVFVDSDYLTLKKQDKIIYKILLNNKANIDDVKCTYEDGLLYIKVGIKNNEGKKINY